MIRWMTGIFGIILIATGLWGILEYVWILGLAKEGVAVALMEGRGVLLGFADYVFAQGVPFAPKTEMLLAIRIIGGYLLFLALGLASVFIVRKRTG